MNTKTIKKEYLVLGAIIIALLLYLVFRSGDKVHYQLPRLDAVAADTLSKIEIVKPDGALTLVKKENKWLIDPRGYPTDETKVKEITDVVGGLRLTALASKAENYARYDLGKDKAVTVKAYAADQVVREFNIGKVTASNNHTFVTLKDDPFVYHAGNSFRRHFDQKADNLRDKGVMKLDTNEISEIRVEKEGEVMTFSKAAKPVETKPEAPEAKKDGEAEKDVTPGRPPVPQTETIWAAVDGKEGNKSELDALLSQMADLKCDGYMEDVKKEDLGEPIYTLTVKGKKEYVLTVFKKQEPAEGQSGGAKYPMVSSENPYPFLLTSYQAERLMKKPEDLLKK